MLMDMVDDVTFLYSTSNSRRENCWEKQIYRPHVNGVESTLVIDLLTLPKSYKGIEPFSHSDQ